VAKQRQLALRASVDTRKRCTTTKLHQQWYVLFANRVYRRFPLAAQGQPSSLTGRATHQAKVTRGTFARAVFRH
jgi:predicted oxidoreductase